MGRHQPRRRPQHQRVRHSHTGAPLLTQTAADLLARCLVAAGARRSFGAPLSDLLPAIDPAGSGVDPAVLAAADGRIGRIGVAVGPDRRSLDVTSQPGADPTVVTVDDPGDLPLVVARSSTAVPSATRIELDLDPDQPVADAVGPARPVRDLVLHGLAPQVRDGRFAVLAGPGVVRGRAVDGLRALAGMTGSGVVNTWGAKGVFEWDDPHHLGTAGLQERDFDLAGLADVDTLVTAGVDPAEVGATPWVGRADVVDLRLDQLALAAGSWPVPSSAPERPRLYTELAAVCGPLYASDAEPRPAARAAAQLAADRPDGGLVVADPGRAGFWVARAFPTTEAGSVIVPARVAPGFAAASALCAALDGRPCVAVTDDPGGCEPAVELARSLGHDLDLRDWSDGTVDLDTTAVEAVAGRVCAWDS